MGRLWTRLVSIGLCKAIPIVTETYLSILPSAKAGSSTAQKVVAKPMTLSCTVRLYRQLQDYGHELTERAVQAGFISKTFPTLPR